MSSFQISYLHTFCRERKGCFKLLIWGVIGHTAIVTTYMVSCSLYFPRKRSGDNFACMLQISFARQVWLWLFKMPTLYLTAILFFKKIFLKIYFKITHIGACRACGGQRR